MSMTPERLADVMFNELQKNFKYYLRDGRYGVNYFFEGIRYCIKYSMDYKPFIRRLFINKSDFVVPLYDRILNTTEWTLAPNVKQDIIDFLEKFVILK